MTSIVTNTYTSQYADILASSQRQQIETQANTAGSPSSNDATKVTLSEAAKAKMSEKTYDTVIADARARMKEILENANRTSPLEGDELAVDLSQLDRRELFAIASNADQNFSVDETKAAALEQQRRFDAALVGPTSVARVTGDVTTLYETARDYLDAASAEEKKTSIWRNQKAAVDEALSHLESSPNAVPTDIKNDPVAGYLKRVANGEAGKEREFSDVTNDARATLDRQYEDAKAAGKRPSQALDVSQFSGRSLSAIALNSNDQFSDTEVRAAKTEVRTRSGNAILAAYEQSKSSSDPTSLAKNIISQYGSMSSEERQAAGWSDDFYKTVLSNYQTSASIAQMFSSSASRQGSMFSGSASGQGGMSLSNFL